MRIIACKRGVAASLGLRRRNSSLTPTGRPSVGLAPFRLRQDQGRFLPRITAIVPNTKASITAMRTRGPLRARVVRGAQPAAGGGGRLKPVLSHILSRPAFATSTARSPSGGHGGGVHVFRIEIPYRLTGYGMSGIGAQEAYNRAGRGSAYWGNAEACVRLQRSAYGRRLARQVTL